MINRDLTDQYLRSFDELAEAIYLCWYNSFCKKTKQINEEKLRTQIRSYGFYPFEKKTKKELPLCFRVKLRFKTLTWVNNLTNVIAEDILCESTELYMLAIKDLRKRLFNLKNREERIALANVILLDLDKNCVHNEKVNIVELNSRLKELFEYILDQNFITEDNVTTLNDGYKVYPIYDLTVRLLNHFDFIDKLIELFLCFNICLISLAEKANCNLFIFNKSNYDLSPNEDLQLTSQPKFKTKLSDECLFKIMHYLSDKKKLINPNADCWLFWFNLKDVKNPEYLIWDGSPTLLSNVIQHLCSESIAFTVKTAFNTPVYVKPTKHKYERSTMYKEIEQIITISMKKNS
ncbi:MAG: hypothetical protein WCH34_18890 [Bacteroidota bacterium]